MSDETKNELPMESEDLVAIDAAADLVLGQTVPDPNREIRRGN